MKGAFTVALDKKKLAKCGFENLKTAAELERIETMIRACLGGDRQEAIRRYALILKKEPKSSRIKFVPLVDMIKSLKRPRPIPCDRPKPSDLGHTHG